MLDLKPLFIFLFLALLEPISAQTIVHQEDFSAGLGSWSAISLSDGNDIWTVQNGAASCNGFGGADDEDWLVSPAINLDLYQEEYLLFDYNDRYNGPKLTLFYSTNYNGGGTATDLAAANWQPLADELLDIEALSCFSTLFQRHPAIALDTISGTSVHFAFRYIGYNNQSKRYKLDNIRILADYYAPINGGQTCCNLKSSLHQLIRQQRKIDYTSSDYDVWDAILQTDLRSNDAGTATIIWDVFTDFPHTTGEYELDPCTDKDQGSCPGGEGGCYQREHSFPKSWWGGGTTNSDTSYTDLHHILPSDGSLNASKSNLPPGIVTLPSRTGSNGFMVGDNPSLPCSSSYFEPIDEYKGDYARMYFYMACRYESDWASWQSLSPEGSCAMMSNSCTAYAPWLLQILLNWHANDPVSSKELDRNNAVYSIQGNRNPFIDHPEWIGQIWGDALGQGCAQMILLGQDELDFEAELISSQRADIIWQLQNANPQAQLQLFRSQNAIDWQLLGQFDAQDHYIDQNISPETTYYFQLKTNQQQSPIISLHTQEQAPLKIAPNPVQNELTIYWAQQLSGEAAIYNLQGQLLKTASFNAKLWQVDLKDLPAGAYLLRLRKGESIQQFKLLKVN